MDCSVLALPALERVRSGLQVWIQTPASFRDQLLQVAQVCLGARAPYQGVGELILLIFVTSIFTAFLLGRVTSDYPLPHLYRACPGRAPAARVIEVGGESESLLRPRCAISIVYEQGSMCS